MSDIDFTDIRNEVLYHLDGVHTSIPGKIVSYDPDTQEASVQILIKETLLDDREFEIPVIDGVPVVFPSAGGGTMTFPIQKGDGVLIIFSERSLDNWVGSNGSDIISPLDKRKHNVTDAIAIPGLTTFPNAQGSNPDHVEISFAGSKFRLKNDGDVEVFPGSGKMVVQGTIEANDVVATGGLLGDVSLKDHKHLGDGGPSVGNTGVPNSDI